MGYDQPLISVDVVCVWAEGGSLRLGLGRRLNEPFAGALALPGVLMVRERSTEAALRALSEKVGITDVGLLRDIGVFDAADRDPRGPTLSIAKLAFITPEAAASSDRMEAVGFDEAPTLPFDHAGIIAAARANLGQLLWADREAARMLLGEDFTTSDITVLGREISGVREHPSNVRRRMEGTGWATLTGQRRMPASGRGRPTAVWTWA